MRRLRRRFGLPGLACNQRGHPPPLGRNERGGAPRSSAPLPRRTSARSQRGGVVLLPEHNNATAAPLAALIEVEGEVPKWPRPLVWLQTPLPGPLMCTCGSSRLRVDAGAGRSVLSSALVGDGFVSSVAPCRLAVRWPRRRALSLRLRPKRGPKASSRWSSVAHQRREFGVEHGPIGVYSQGELPCWRRSPV